LACAPNLFLAVMWDIILSVSYLVITETLAVFGPFIKAGIFNEIFGSILNLTISLDYALSDVILTLPVTDDSSQLFSTIWIKDLPCCCDWLEEEMSWFYENMTVFL